MEELEKKESKNCVQNIAFGNLSNNEKQYEGSVLNEISKSPNNRTIRENIQGQQSENDKMEARLPDIGRKTELINDILDHVQECSAIFKNQQIGEPELTKSEKRSLAQDLLLKSPSNFLTRFGMFLCDHHFEYFLSIDNAEVSEHAKQIKMSLQSDKKLQQKNRRYEALKQLEAEGSYFSEAEMEKREPLLYHEMVGQFLTEKEKLIKNRQRHSNTIPSFSNFLIDKMERDELTALRKSQQEEENNIEDDMSDEDVLSEPFEQNNAPRWGDDWVDAEKCKKQKHKKPKKKKNVQISLKEKAFLFAEFKSLMHSKFLNGLEPEFNYDEVDLNPEYDSLQTRSQDAEDKYFDEESCDGNICTDTGIEDY